MNPDNGLAAIGRAAWAPKKGEGNCPFGTNLQIGWYFILGLRIQSLVYLEHSADTQSPNPKDCEFEV